MIRSFKYFRIFSTLLAALIVIQFTGCNEDEQPIVEIDEDTVEMESISDADFDEIDDLVAVGMGAAEDPSSPGSRTSGIDDERFRCAEVTINRETRTLIIDFGDGCEGPRGRIRSGIVRITYSGFRFLPGSVITTTLEHFAIDGRQIEGTRVVENISESLQVNPSFHIILTGGKITFEDGLEATREVDRVRTWVRAPNPINDEWHILENSTAFGSNRKGNSYEVTVVETLVYKRKCRNDRVFLPVSGVKEIIRGDNLIVIDYGDGECDNIVTASFNGVIKTIEIKAHNPNG